MEKQTFTRKETEFYSCMNCQQADSDHAKENNGAVIDVNCFPYL